MASRQSPPSLKEVNRFYLILFKRSIIILAEDLEGTASCLLQLTTLMMGSVLAAPSKSSVTLGLGRGVLR
jgi:hypothetical protein